MGRWGGVALAVVLTSGCAWDAPPPPRHSEAMEASARMLAKLDHLEAELDGQAAELQVFQVLVDRHGHAQQLACKVTDEHLAEIQRLALKERRKVQRRRHGRGRLLSQARTSGEKLVQR